MPIGSNLEVEAIMLHPFPEEIIHDILLRLPLKNLIRCTSVCKPWNLIIKSSRFIHGHLKAQGTTRDLLLHHGCYKTIHSKIDEEEEFYSLHHDNHAFDEYRKIYFQIDRIVGKTVVSFRVAGVCNGVMCLKAHDILCGDLDYVLWNPSIRKAVRLPWPDVTFTSHGPFDDTIGFGVDALTSDYKVVRLVSLDQYCNREPTLAEVYSVATGSWRRSLDSIAFCCELSPRLTYVFFNGAIHWALRRLDDNCSFILTFDVGSESFGEIMMPESIRSDKFLRGSKVSVTGDRKSLALFTSSRKDYGHDPFLHIWVMKEYGVQESWTKLMTPDPGSGLHGQLSFSDEVLLLQHEPPYDEEYVLASLDLASWKMNRPKSCQNKYSYSVRPYDYEESLVLLNVDSAVSY